MEKYENLLISGSKPCLQWNIGKAAVVFVAIHVCGYDEYIIHMFIGDLNASSYYNDAGRIVRKRLFLMSLIYLLYLFVSWLHDI